jgi:uncharacterized protein involved in cysteine biosynthesis
LTRAAFASVRLAGAFLLRVVLLLCADLLPRPGLPVAEVFAAAFLLSAVFANYPLR